MSGVPVPESGVLRDSDGQPRLHPGKQCVLASSVSRAGGQCTGPRTAGPPRPSGPVTQPCAPARHSATAPEAESCPCICCDGAVSLPRACPAGGGNRHGPERGGKRQRPGLCPRLPESTPAGAGAYGVCQHGGSLSRQPTHTSPPKASLCSPVSAPPAHFQGRAGLTCISGLSLVWLLLLGIIILRFIHVDASLFIFITE